MKASILIVAVTLMLLAILSQVAGQEQKAPEGKQTEVAEPQEFSFWMNVKLTESQKLFAAISRADFDTLVTSSETLETLNAVEGFVRRGTRGYSTQLDAFEFAIDEIKKQARQENIEGVTLGFQQLTLSCVNCHKQIRQTVSHTDQP